MEYPFDLEDLALVAAIARTGSISAAAELQGVTQSTVTKQLKRLETRLGFELFERHSRGVAATPCGRRLLDHAGLLERQIKDAVDDLAAVAGGEAGTVRVGAGPTWTRGPLPPALASLVKAHPRIHVQVRTDPVEHMLDQLLAGRVDLVLAPWIEDAPWHELDWQPVMIDDLRVMARRGHPLLEAPPRRLADLAPYGWVLSTPANPTRRRLNRIFHHEGLTPPEPVIEAPSVDLTSDIVRQSDLLTVLPDVPFDRERRGILPLENPLMSWRRASGMYRRRQAATTPATLALIDALKRVCAAYYGEVAEDPERALASR